MLIAAFAVLLNQKPYRRGLVGADFVTPLDMMAELRGSEAGTSFSPDRLAEFGKPRDLRFRLEISCLQAGSLIPNGNNR